MFRRVSVMVAILAVVLVVPAAHAANWTVGVNGGLTKPTGDAGKDLKMGPVGGITVCMHVNDMIAVGVDGNFFRNKHKDVGVTEDLGGGDTATLDKDNITLMSGGVHGMYMFPVGEASKVSPFALAGLGFYNAKEDYQETVVLSGTTFVFTDESDGVKGSTRFGGKVGAGAMFKATEKVGISLSGDYNIVSLDTQGVSGAPSTYKFYAIRAGLNFHIMAQ
jgi:opacity protein-like surface antigen